jgi:hypothetical protein
MMPSPARAAAGHAPAPGEPLDLAGASAISIDATCTRLGSGPQGLTAAVAAARLAEF